MRGTKTKRAFVFIGLAICLGWSGCSDQSSDPGNEGTGADTDVDTDADTDSDTDWQLPEEYYYDNQSEVPLRIIHPRPDGGTGRQTVYDWARHKWAHSQFRYQIPIATQGGAYPYKYEIIGIEGTDYPTGMSIGELWNEPDYGILTWAPSGQTQNSQWIIFIRVTDQTSRYQEISWTLELDDDMFRFQDPVNGSHSATGTWNDPYLEMADWYGANSSSVALTQYKIMVYREGTHYPVANPTFTGWAVKPMAHIGVPNENVTFDLNNCGQFLMCQGAEPFNTYFADIHFDGNNATATTNVRVFYVSGGGSQFTAFNLSVTDQATGTQGNNNEAVFYIDDPHSGYQREDIALINIETYDLPRSRDGNNGYSLTILYASKNILIEGCEDYNSAAARHIFMKCCPTYTTIRNNYFVDSTQANNGIINHYNANADGWGMSGQEVCYNYIRTLNGYNGITFNTSGWTDLHNKNCYRNTVLDGGIYARYIDYGPYGDRNVLENVVIDSSEPINAGCTVPSGHANIIESVNNNVIDSITGYLTETYLNNNTLKRGIYGHELASPGNIGGLFTGLDRGLTLDRAVLGH